LAANAGFQAPANAALASASASDAAQRLTGQEADCRNLAHALAALTGIEPVSLAQRLGAGEAAAKLPQPKALAVNQVPAELLAQRPDIAAAERDVAAASADIGAAEAARYPKLSLTGSIGPAALRLVGGSVSAITWAIAPALSVPLFDGGRINANIEAAKANYAAQEIVYRAKVRGAVREVQEALTRIEAAAAREGEADVAAKGFVASFNAAQARFNAGLGSLIELEDARRTLLAADLGLQGIRRERVDAWLALYRALGGGWQELPTPTQPTQ
jgi:outer membrane protein, multidrug efflux system